MFFEITTQNGVPVYDQIARQIKFAVADGALQAGELIPSVRELAKELAVNPNTVARAYRQLQAEEVVEAVPGTGLAVRAGARRVCHVERRALMKERMRLALVEAISAGLEMAEVRSLVESELARLAKE